MTPYIFQRGETISLALDAVSGDISSVSAITADLKAVSPGRTTVAASTPVAARFAVSSRAASGDSAGGWMLTIDAATSVALTPGAYLADARLAVAGGIVITEPVAIRIRDAVTS
jgi:hypothetical protein